MVLQTTGLQSHRQCICEVCAGNIRQWEFALAAPWDVMSGANLSRWKKLDVS